MSRFTDTSPGRPGAGEEPSQTSLVRDFVPGPGSSGASLLGGLDADIYLTISPADERTGLELWRTNL